MGKLTEQRILKRSTYGQKHEEMLNILGYKGNANQNYIEIPPHPSQKAIINNINNNKCWQRCGEKGAILHCWWEQYGDSSKN
jgi:hypothetical protein